MKKYFILFSISLLANFGFAHKFYVSTSNMEYNEATKTIDVSIKMTAHDFEHILESKFNQRIHIETVADTSEIGLFIVNHMKENFQINSEKTSCEFHYLGKEVTLRDELFFYISFTNVTNPKSIQIKNTLLFSQFAQQQNIVHYKCGELSKSVTLVSSKPEEEIKFD